MSENQSYFQSFFGSASPAQLYPGASMFSTDPYVNPAQAEKYSPVISHADGTSSLSSGLFGFLGNLVNAAGSAYTATNNAQAEQNRLSELQRTRTANSVGGVPWLVIGVIGAGILAVVGFIFLRRRK
jgi:hypothetical protein